MNRHDSAKTLSQQFIADLNAVYSTTALRLPPSFIADLESVLATAKTKPPVEDFQFLEIHLREWRRSTRDRLKEWMASLPPDDPLLCPISLFGTMDYGRLETAHTRTLAWLLDPNREHGFGNELIESLLSHVQGGEVPPGRILIERVESELPFNLPGSGRMGRIDVFAKGKWIKDDSSWLLVIEAKIDASEAKDQLAQIEDWTDEDGTDVFRVFLTHDARKPESAQELRNWSRLAFSELASILWSAGKKQKDKAGYHFLRYYLAGVLQDVCGWPFPIEADYPDPYSMLSYIKEAQGFHTEA
jgi:hypothetical protein